MIPRAVCFLKIVAWTGACAFALAFAAILAMGLTMPDLLAQLLHG